MSKFTAGRAWFRLQSALHAGTGHVVVTAPEREKAAALVDAALERSSALLVLRVRAVSADPLAVIDEGVTDKRSASSRRETLRELLEKARAVDANVFAVVEDADSATAEQLERVRMAVECVPDAIERLRVVLVGTPQLDVTLQEPGASALASRVSAHVRFAAPRKTAAVVALNTWSAFRVAAAGVITVAVATLFGRNEAPSQRKFSSEPATAREVGAKRVDTNDDTPPAAAVSAGDAPVTAPLPESAPAALADVQEVQGEQPSPVVAAVPDPPASDVSSSVTEARNVVSVERAPSTAIAHVAAQVARGARASREGSASVDSRGARAGSSVVPAKRSPETSAAASRSAEFGPRLKQPVVMEAEAFKDPADAEALQKQLAERFDRVLVTRIDAARGPLYSVRVMDLESPRQIAHAERELRTLGHRPVRISAAPARATISVEEHAAVTPTADEGGAPTGAFRPRVPHR